MNSNDGKKLGLAARPHPICESLPVRRKLNPSSAQQKRVSGEFAISRIRFLVVGGFPLIRFGLRCVLADLGYRDVVEASDSKTALSWLETQGADFVITVDDQFTHSDIGFIRLLRADMRRRRIPILALRDTSHDVHPLLDAGADGFLVMPNDTKKLFKEIQRILDQDPNFSFAEKNRLNIQSAR